MHTQQLPWHRSHTWRVGPGHQHWHLALDGDVSSRASVKKHLLDPKTTPVFSGRSQNVFGYNVTSQRQESAVAGRGVVSRARRALTPEGQAPRFRVVSAPQHARTCRAAGTTSSLRVFTENHVPGTALGAAPKPEVQPGRHTRRHLINLIMRYRPPSLPQMRTEAHEGSSTCLGSGCVRSDSHVAPQLLRSVLCQQTMWQPLTGF